MSFNSDVSKQVQEVIFSRKKNIKNHPFVSFNNLPINRKSTQKHLVLLLDEKLNFSEHINEKLKKATKSVNLLRKLNLSLPRSALLIIHKSFIRPHLDYGDIVYDQPNKSSLSEKIESLQYNAALAITGAIKSSSKEKLYQERGFESLKDRRWMRKLCCLYKIMSSRFRHNFADTLNPLCSCSLETVTTAHFFLRCRNYTDVRLTLMKELYRIDNSITSRQPNELLRIILYGNSKFKDNVNKQILIATIQFIKNSNRFNQSLI